MDTASASSETGLSQVDSGRSEANPPVAAQRDAARLHGGENGARQGASGAAQGAAGWMMGIQRVCVLDVEPELCDGLAADSLPSARRASVAATWSLPKGHWQSEPWMFDCRGSLGLLILDGLLARHVGVGGMESVELIGPGDVLRPWIAIDGEISNHVHERWTVSRRTHLAILDRAFALAVSPWPEISANINDRLAMRVSWMAVSAAIQGLRRIDDRLLATLWSYADRWGRVTPEGVALELDLTHRVLAGVIGARRPSVTTALKALEATGALTRRADRSWLLHGERPESLAVDGPSEIAAVRPSESEAGRPREIGAGGSQETETAAVTANAANSSARYSSENLNSLAAAGRDGSRSSWMLNASNVTPRTSAQQR